MCKFPGKFDLIRVDDNMPVVEKKRTIKQMLTSFHVGKCLGFVHIFYILCFYVYIYFILYIHDSVTLTSENPFFSFFFLGGSVGSIFAEFSCMY